MSNRDTFLTIVGDVLAELVPEATVDVNPDVLSRPEPGTIRVVVGEVEDEPDGRLIGYDVRIAVYGNNVDLLPEDTRRSKMTWDRGVTSALEKARPASGRILGLGKRRRRSPMIRWGEGLSRGQSATMIGGLRAQPYSADAVSVLPSRPTVAEVDQGVLADVLARRIRTTTQYDQAELRASIQGTKDLGDGRFKVDLLVSPNRLAAWSPWHVQANLRAALEYLTGTSHAHVGQIVGVDVTVTPLGVAAGGVGWNPVTVGGSRAMGVEAVVTVDSGQQVPVVEEAVVGGE